MRFVKLLLPMAVLAAPLAAQGFEGTVSMNIPAADGSINSMKYLVKGDQAAVIMTAGASMGPMAGAEIRMIIDVKAGKTTMLIPLSGDMAAQFGAMGGGNMKGIKQVIDLNQAAARVDTTTFEVHALGTSQTIAGHKCNDFEIASAKEVTRVCLSTDMGTFTFPTMGGGAGGRGRGAASSPAWTHLLASHPGYPLKAWTPDGKVTFEVTKIEKGTVDPSMFEIPEGYMDMGGMFGGRGRGGGN
jgi:hypothetical protein